MSENKHTPEPWRRITAPGQVKVGDRLRFNIGDDKFDAVAKEILFPCSEREEIIYNKTRNYYLITSMCMANKGSQKNVEFLSVETIESATKQRDELLAENEQLRKDAERYRVLRDSEYQLDEDDPSVSDSFFNQYFGEELDAAVDELKSRFDSTIASVKEEQ